MKKISIFLLIIMVIFGLRYIWTAYQQKTPQEQQAELAELQKNSGASFVNYRYTVKEPQNNDFEVDTSQIEYSKSQEKIWQTLKNARYKFENGWYKPLFSEEQYVLDSTKVALQGFMIPMQESTQQNFFLLSYFPYAMCFFCGNAEPQTVVEVYISKPLPYQDESIQVEGILRLNDQNPEQLFYILENATLIN